MSTRIGEAIRDLGDVIGAIEAGRGDVVHVGPTGDGLVADNTVEISISVRLPFLPDDPGSAPGLSVTDAALDDDGSLRVNLIAARPVDDGSSTGAMAGDESGGQAGNDGPADGTTENEAADESGDEPMPAYRDPVRLRAVYDAHDTFAAMTEALDVDVTPQTVRRHMIKHGIHEPSAGPAEDGNEETAADEGAEEPGSASTARRADGTDAVAADAVPPGLGIDEDVTLEEVKEAIRSARTIHEVGQRLGIPRERAFKLLNTLDLIDLVSGRLQTADRRISAEELDQRFARATAGGE